MSVTPWLPADFQRCCTSRKRMSGRSWLIFSSATHERMNSYCISRFVHTPWLWQILPHHNITRQTGSVVSCGVKIGIYLSTLSSCFSCLFPSLSVSLQGMHELLAPIVFVLHCDHQAFQHASETANPRSDLFTTQARLLSRRPLKTCSNLTLNLFCEVFRFFNHYLLNFQCFLVYLFKLHLPFCT